jgi:3-methyladenine DNA glycosylase AlkD
MKFFKTGPGEYWEWDIFLGITVPNTRLILKNYINGLKKRDVLNKWSSSEILLSQLLSDTEILLMSPYHEERLIGVLIFVKAMDIAKKNTGKIREIGEKYFKYRAQINNWDLVDVSSPQVIGVYRSILNKEEQKGFIDQCLWSNHLWTERILALSYFNDIKNGDASEFLRLAPEFFWHPHDLMHKAVGWMLREIGKRVSKEILRDYMKLHSKEMPRTMLRYAIEHFDEVERRGFMSLVSNI